MTTMYDAPVRHPAARSAGNSVRTCSTCGRPLPALTKDEYTRARAGLVAARGICVCRQPQEGSWRDETSWRGAERL